LLTLLSSLSLSLFSLSLENQNSRTASTPLPMKRALLRKKWRPRKTASTR
jgi:hypothetical protein